MADTVLMNLIIAVISFGRRDALLKRRKRVGEESRASLCVGALEMRLHCWEQCACSRPCLFPMCIQCGGLDADTLLNTLIFTVAKGQPVHHQRVRLIPGFQPCQTSQKPLPEGGKEVMAAAWCLWGPTGKVTTTSCVGYFKS